MAEPAAASPEVPVHPVTGRPLKWYQGIDRYCWLVLVIAALGWLFDTMDQNLFTLVRVPSLRELLKPVVEAGRPEIERRLQDEKRQKGLDPTVTKEAIDKAVAAELVKEVKIKAGWVTSIFIIGWATGGLVFGILGDRIGRTKTMIVTIVTYAIFTGLSGLVHSWQLYSAMRFMTGLGVGGEWAAGAALVAEVFPARSRAMALGLLQALSAVGNMLAAVITIIVAKVVSEENQASSWRYVYFVGFLPSLLVLWIRSSVREPERWVKTKMRSEIDKLAREVQRLEREGVHDETRKNRPRLDEMHAEYKKRFNEDYDPFKEQAAPPGRIIDLFTHPLLRRNTLCAVMMALAGMIGLWGIGFFSPEMLRGELAGKSEREMATLSSWMFFLQNAGSFFGIYVFAAFSERFGRRPAFFLWFALAWVSVLAYFWGLRGAGHGAFNRALVLAPIMGFCTLGPFSGYTLYFPYLYPTRLRATGCGFCYNVARYVVPIGPLAFGQLAVSMGGFAPAATVISVVYIFGFVGTWLGPETKGRPLPEDKDFEMAPKPATAS